MLLRMRALPSRLRSLTEGRLARNAGSMLLGQVGRVALQGAYFVVIARALGVEGFGAFAGLVALVALIAPFGSLGAINLMIRHIVNDPSTAPSQFATALKVTSLAGVAMTALLLVAAPWVAPNEVGLLTIACVCIAELLGARLIEVAGGVYTAKEQMLRTAGFQLWLNGVRLAGAGALWLSPLEFTLNNWAMTYLLTSSTTTASILWVVRRHVGPAHGQLAQFRHEWREGILFSFSLASQSVYNDIDKAMLARLSTLEATGIYTAAYRVVDMAFTPMRALLNAAYPRFFRHGRQGLRPALQFTRQLAVPGISYCLGATIVLLVGAPLIPVILGSDYSASVDALRALAVLPLLKAMHYLAADTLTGAGYQGLRSIVQISVAILNVGLNFALIPSFGYWGAVYASLLSDGLLALLLWIVVWHRRRTGVTR